MELRGMLSHGLEYEGASVEIQGRWGGTRRKIRVRVAVTHGP